MSSYRENATLRTIRDFGEQWTEFPSSPGYYGSLDLLQDIAGPLLDTTEIRGADVAEIGSGSGRITRTLAEAGAGLIVALEPSAAIEVARRNCADLTDRVRWVQARGEGLPGDGVYDLVLSIGVLHHIPDPRPVIRRVFEAIKPGGRALIWVYGREGNALYLALTRPLRIVTRRLPHRMLVALCRALDWPLRGYIALSRRLPLPLAGYVRGHLAFLDPWARRLTIYDQLNPAWAKYYRREEVQLLLTSAGFVNVRLHHRHGYSWTAIGTKPSA